jgi:hypothetical protein
LSQVAVAPPKKKNTKKYKKIKTLRVVFCFLGGIQKVIQGVVAAPKVFKF